MLIQIDKGDLMSINALWRLVLRRIYDPEHAGESDLWLINHNHEKWLKIIMENNKQIIDAFGDKAMAEPVGQRGSVIDEIEYQITMMAKMLVADESGDLDNNAKFGGLSKAAYRMHKIDYRKSFPNVFPECRPRKADLARAQEYKRINDKDNRDIMNNN